jgi:hypothetical protein
MRIAFAAVVGALVASLRLALPLDAADLSIPLAAGRLLLAGGDPYAVETHGWPSNPLTTVLVLLPLAYAPPSVAAAVVVGLSTGLLVWGALRSGEPLRLWALASWPFWYAVLYAQWSILFLAMLLLPSLAWLAPVKPQLGLSVLLSGGSTKQALYAACFVLLTLILVPAWPWLWLAQMGGYGGFIPALYIAPLVALVLWRERSPRALLYVLFCCSPQRLWYDQLLLWYVPGRGWQLALMAGASWLCALSISAVPLPWIWTALLTQFIPCALFLLLTPRRSSPRRTSEDYGSPR